MDDDVPRRSSGLAGEAPSDSGIPRGRAPASDRPAADPASLPAIADGRSPFLTTCPFFRSDGSDGRLGPPIEAPDSTNRCAAFGEPKPQSTRQQELVCLAPAHVNCPRYLRGALIAREAAAALPNRRTLTRATLAAILLLAASVSASFAFVLVRGGLTLPINEGSKRVAAVATGTPGPSATAAASSVVAPTPSPAISPSPSAFSSVTPTISPSPAPTPSPTVNATPSPRPTSDRYALLEPCPNEPDCWIYIVRAGDNLVSIANYFGVSLDRVYDLNPWARTTPLRAGQELVLPPPTR